MHYFIGTSGYNYPEWRGSFYPEKFPTSKMLAFYAERFNTVEVNYTFYRMPTPPLLEGWAAGTPEAFAFTLKAPRRITHDSKLQHVEDLTQTFCRTAATLGSKLGALLFQLPPTFKKDVAVLRDFVDLLPDGTRAAFEFRHPSWFVPEIYAFLRQHDAALVIGDTPERKFQPHELTAGWTFLRFHYGSRGRGGNYSDRELDEWAARIDAWRRSGIDVYAYFNNDWEGYAIRNALGLKERLGVA